MIDPHQHHRAIEKFPVWVEKDFIKMFPNFSDNLISNKNIVFQWKDRFSNYLDKTLMLIGGGPSSSDISWKENSYDYLWSMNQFYKSKIFENVRVDLAMIMSETNLDDEALINKANNDNTLLGFESHDKWMNYDFKKDEKYFCMHTRFYGKIGIGARMKIFAAQLGFSKVYFTGFDGPEEILLGNHAFEPGKTTLPSVFLGQPEHLICAHHKKQYDYLWEFIKMEYPKTTFINLGGGEKYHERSK